MKTTQQVCTRRQPATIPSVALQPLAEGAFIMNTNKTDNLRDITGRTFNRWTAIKFTRTTTGRSGWLCRCKCGVEKVVDTSSLTRGITKSCGCFNLERLSETKRTHGAWVGGKEKGTHTSWRMMVSRCTDPNSNRYAAYGGRGIKVCHRWVVSYLDFLEDMGDRPAGMTLERKDNEGDYEPSNCEWATQKQQQNHRRNNVVLTVGGVSQTVAQWADARGVNAKTIYARIKMKWSPERAVATPIRGAETRMGRWDKQPGKTDPSRFFTELSGGV